jgi:hypothetical protein
MLTVTALGNTQTLVSAGALQIGAATSGRVVMQDVACSTGT